MSKVAPRSRTSIFTVRAIFTAAVNKWVHCEYAHLLSAKVATRFEIAGIGCLNCGSGSVGAAKLRTTTRSHSNKSRHSLR
jgi:hypothetical protein